LISTHLLVFLFLLEPNPIVWRTFFSYRPAPLLLSLPSQRATASYSKLFRTCTYSFYPSLSVPLPCTLTRYLSFPPPTHPTGHMPPVRPFSVLRGAFLFLPSPLILYRESSMMPMPHVIYFRFVQGVPLMRPSDLFLRTLFALVCFQGFVLYLPPLPDFFPRRIRTRSPPSNFSQDQPSFFFFSTPPPSYSGR